MTDTAKREALIEKMALGAYNRFRTQRGMRPVEYIAANQTPELTRIRAECEAHLAAIEASGFAVVPEEAIAAQQQAFLTQNRLDADPLTRVGYELHVAEIGYRVMIAAGRV